MVILLIMLLVSGISMIFYTKPRKLGRVPTKKQMKAGKVRVIELQHARNINLP